MGSSQAPLRFLGIAADKFDGEGTLTDPETREDVRDLLVSLGAWTRRLRSAGEAVGRGSAGTRVRHRVASPRLWVIEAPCRARTGVHR